MWVWFRYRSCNLLNGYRFFGHSVYINRNTRWVDVSSLYAFNLLILLMFTDNSLFLFQTSERTPIQLSFWNLISSIFVLETLLCIKRDHSRKLIVMEQLRFKAQGNNNQKQQPRHFSKYLFFFFYRSTYIFWISFTFFTNNLNNI